MLIINFLPWREVVQKRLKRNYYSSLIIVIAILLMISGIISLRLSRHISLQQRDHQLLAEQLAKLATQNARFQQLQQQKQQQLDELKKIYREKILQQNTIALTQYLLQSSIKKITLQKILWQKNQLIIHGWFSDHNVFNQYINTLKSKKSITLIKVDLETSINQHDGKNNHEKMLRNNFVTYLLINI